MEEIEKIQIMWASPKIGRIVDIAVAKPDQHSAALFEHLNEWRFDFSKPAFRIQVKSSRWSQAYLKSIALSNLLCKYRL